MTVALMSWRVSPGLGNEGSWGRMVSIGMELLWELGGCSMVKPRSFQLIPPLSYPPDSALEGWMGSMG